MHVENSNILDLGVREIDLPKQQVKQTIQPQTNNVDHYRTLGSPVRFQPFQPGVLNPAPPAAQNQPIFKPFQPNAAPAAQGNEFPRWNPPNLQRK
jgi:hypothetical protein